MRDIRDLEKDEERVERFKSELEGVRREISEFHVFGADQDEIESDLSSLSDKLRELVDSAKRASEDIQSRYQASQQLIPTDLAQSLTSLELSAEETIHAMDEKQRDLKRAKTTRTEYLSDVEQVQDWLRDAELKVQDRSAEPSKLMDNLRQVQNELTLITSKHERLTKNGQDIIDNTRDEKEKEVIAKTVMNLGEQLGQVRSWLDEKKQAVGDTMDAWQRFLSLYESVKAWTQEKRLFLAEPLELSTLSQARQRLHDYSVSFQALVK